VKATQKDFLRGLPAGALNARIFFFCGPDEAGASAAANRVAAALPDPATIGPPTNKKDFMRSWMTGGVPTLNALVLPALAR
jgi:hypothetical protein